MPLSRRIMIQAGLATMGGGLSRAQGRDVLRIGVLTDLSGPYADSAGASSVACTRMAAEEFMAAAPGIRVEVLQADHLNKPDVALGIARQWFDQDGVDVITNCNNSAIAFAVNGLAREKDKIQLNTGAAASDLTGPQCSPNFVHWTYDTWQIAHAVGTATVKAGGDRWYFIAADYAFGRAMQRDLSRWVEQSGGRVLGTAYYPFPGTTDFSSYLLAAQASGANVVGLLNAGADFTNCIKQGREFGVSPKVRLIGTVAFITDVHAMGLGIAEGLTYSESFYWDLNARTRAFTERAVKRSPRNWPNAIHAGDYAATTHYLKVANQMGAGRAKISGAAVVAAMKALPTDDDAYGAGLIRQDGRHIHPVYLLQAKAPNESRGEWDCLKLIDTLSSETAFRPLSEGGCPLVKA